jgi:hypothetical protein
VIFLSCKPQRAPFGQLHLLSPLRVPHPSFLRVGLSFDFAFDFDLCLFVVITSERSDEGSLLLFAALTVCVTSK